MFGKDIGTVMHPKTLVIVTFVFSVVWFAKCCGHYTALILVQFREYLLK